MTTIADTILDSRTDKKTEQSNSNIDAKKDNKEKSEKIEVSKRLYKESIAENENKEKPAQEVTEDK
jgi:hypothetical protein